ncbi:MAG: Abi family protein [Mycoplasmataceae bacterium]|jgi:abortive infection bacteriophage resistance protein|nr:Abi family protein [Mycoplasmataceae bacterium]
MTKPFLTFEQQIDHLHNDLNLDISNRERLLKYLEKYNYENLINEFAYPFKDSTGYKFINRTSSNDIVALFNFDQSIRMNILSHIFTIEKHLNTCIAYCICKEYP